MNNIYNLLTTMSVLTIFSIGVGNNEPSYANIEDWKWASADQHYNCTSSVNTITKTPNVNSCGDLNRSSNVWETSGNSWDLDPKSGGHAVYAWKSLPSGVGGETSVWYSSSSGLAYYAYIVMNKNLSWEDSAQDTSSSGYDWRSFTGHEFGHLAGVAHEPSSSVMDTSIGPDTIQRSPSSHDESHMDDMY